MLVKNTNLFPAIVSLLLVSSLSASEESEEVHVFSADDVIPEYASSFGPTADYYRAAIDAQTLKFLNGERFQYDTYPYTAVLLIENPDAQIRIYYWDTVEAARKGFEEGYKTLTANKMVETTKIKEVNGNRFYQRWVLRRKSGVVVVLRNVIFSVEDYTDTLSDAQLLSTVNRYINYLKSLELVQAPSGSVGTAAPSLVEEPSLPTEIRQWKNNKGMTIKGKVIALDAEASAVVFEREDGKKYDALPLSIFSEDSRKEIQRLAAEGN